MKTATLVMSMVSVLTMMTSCSREWCVDVKYMDDQGRLVKDTTICTKDRYIMLGEGDVIYDIDGTVVIKVDGY